MWLFPERRHGVQPGLAHALFRLVDSGLVDGHLLGASMSLSNILGTCPIVSTGGPGLRLAASRPYALE